MKTAITPAKIGRSMKKLEMFMAARSAAAGRQRGAGGRRPAGRRSGGGRLTLLDLAGLRRDLLARTRALAAANDDAILAGDAAADHAEVAAQRTGHHGL